MRTLLAGLVMLGGCAGLPAAPANILEIHQSADWQYADGAQAAASLQRGVSAIARRDGRAATIAQLEEAGYACEYGEAHEDYPEPMAVCTRSFATRACQFDWEVALTSDPARPGKVETSDTAFRRDCVDKADDWPVPVDSAIGDQLTPAPGPG